MKELPSSQFRATFHTLAEPVTVTVNGHPIATYVPIHSAIDARILDAIRPGEPMEHSVRVARLAEAVDRELARASSLLPDDGFDPL